MLFQHLEGEQQHGLRACRRLLALEQKGCLSTLQRGTNEAGRRVEMASLRGARDRARRVGPPITTQRRCVASEGSNAQFDVSLQAGDSAMPGRTCFSSVIHSSPAAKRLLAAERSATTPPVPPVALAANCAAATDVWATVVAAAG
eukprot:scaffold181179_cov33-Tisochrysis_lutea.AAC.4